MEEKEIVALYIINKHAKQIRDDIYCGRSILKKRLFEIYDYDEEANFPERFGLDISLDYLEDEICDKTNKELLKRKYSLDEELEMNMTEILSILISQNYIRNLLVLIITKNMKIMNMKIMNMKMKIMNMIINN